MFAIQLLVLLGLVATITAEVDYDFQQFIGTACPDDDKIASYTGASGDCYPCAEDGLCESLKVTCDTITDTGNFEYTIEVYTSQDCQSGGSTIVDAADSGTCQTDPTLTWGFIVSCYNENGSSKKDDDDENDCFHGDEEVTLASGATKPISEVVVGDSIQVMRSDETLGFSDVVFVPHKSNMKPSLFVEIGIATEVEDVRSLKVTPEHLILNGACGATAELTKANEVQVGSCVHTVSGERKVSRVGTVADKGVYTAVTADMHGHIVVNGIVASSFGTNHFVPNMYYNVHRALYAVLPQWIMESEIAKASNMLIGGFFISASAPFRK